MTTLLGYTCDLIIIYPSQCEARYVYHMDEWLRPFRPLLETVIEIGKTYVRLYSSFTSSYVRHCFVSFITDKHTVVTRQPSGPQNATETAGRGALPNLASRWQDRHVHSRLSGRRAQGAGSPVQLASTERHSQESDLAHPGPSSCLARSPGQSAHYKVKSGCKPQETCQETAHKLAQQQSKLSPEMTQWCTCIDGARAPG